MNNTKLSNRDIRNIVNNYYSDIFFSLLKLIELHCITKDCLIQILDDLKINGLFPDSSRNELLKSFDFYNN